MKWVEATISSMRARDAGLSNARTAGVIPNNRASGVPRRPSGSRRRRQYGLRLQLRRLPCRRRPPNPRTTAVSVGPAARSSPEVECRRLTACNRQLAKCLDVRLSDSADDLAAFAVAAQRTVAFGFGIER
jgi:hypothetical protein